MISAFSHKLDPLLSVEPLRVEDEDISTGREIVAILRPFLEHLLTSGCARKTPLRHRDPHLDARRRNDLTPP
ncbi:hypothetical protein PSAB6_460030 [Paraburkholderia sabiae]|nr:hypothetical protein PSAB6_460030 [Paraburkholderia sabiae]